MNANDKNLALLLIQLESLLKLQELQHRTLIVRAALRIQNEFVGRSVYEKYNFIKWATSRCVYKLFEKLPKSVTGPLNDLIATKPRQMADKGSEQFINVGIFAHGGIGDLIVSSCLVYELYNYLGKCNIDIYCGSESNARFVFSGASHVRNIIDGRLWTNSSNNYDVILEVNVWVRYSVNNSQRVIALKPELLSLIEGATKRLEQYDFLCRHEPYFDGLFAKFSVLKGLNRVDALGYFANLKIGRNTQYYLAPAVSEYDHVLKILDEFPSGYITVHDGFDNNWRQSIDRATKCWSVAQWATFVQLFKRAFPQIGVLQIGGPKNSHPIPGVDRCLIGTTNLDQAAWLIKHSMLHVDSESGLVHVGRALHTKSLVIFGPTNSEFFAYSQNLNVVSSACGNCWWTTRDWLAKCPRGLPEPECMESVSPDHVFATARGYIESLTPDQYALISMELYSSRLLTLYRATLNDLLDVSAFPGEDINTHADNCVADPYILPSRQWEYLFVWEQLMKIFSEKSSALSVANMGDSRGTLAIYLARKGYSVHVFDTGHLRDRCGETNVDQRDRTYARKNGINWNHGTLFNIAADDDTFDVVNCLSILDHVPHKFLALKEAFRIVKPGGVLILTFSLTSTPEQFDNAKNLDVLTPEQLDNFLARLSIAATGFDSHNLDQSVHQIREDKVPYVPVGVTIAGIAVRKIESACRYSELLS